MTTAELGRIGGAASVDAALAAIDAQAEALVVQTEAWSAINSGSREPAGLARMADALELALSGLPGTVERASLPPTTIVRADGAIVAADAQRLPTIAGYRMPGRSANAQLIRFDGMGIAVSAGRACSSGSLKASPVLTAMGHPHPAEVIRVSVGRETTEDEVMRFLAAWREIAA
jgi:cysteine desulfurase